MNIYTKEGQASSEVANSNNEIINLPPQQAVQGKTSDNPYGIDGFTISETINSYYIGSPSIVELAPIIITTTPKETPWTLTGPDKEFAVYPRKIDIKGEAQTIYQDSDGDFAVGIKGYRPCFPVTMGIEDVIKEWSLIFVDNHSPASGLGVVMLKMKNQHITNPAEDELEKPFYIEGDAKLTFQYSGDVECPSSPFKARVKEGFSVEIIDRKTNDEIFSYGLHKVLSAFSQAIYGEDSTYAFSTSCVYKLGEVTEVHPEL
jgi:hypothetical protein